MSDEIRLEWRNLLGDFMLEFAEAEVDVYAIFEDFAQESEIAEASGMLFKPRATAAIQLMERVVGDPNLSRPIARSLNELITLADNVRNLIAHNPLQMSLEGVISGSNEHEIRSFRNFEKVIGLEELKQEYGQLVHWRDELFNCLIWARHKQSWWRSQNGSA